MAKPHDRISDHDRIEELQPMVAALVGTSRLLLTVVDVLISRVELEPDERAKLRSAIAGIRKIHADALKESNKVVKKAKAL